LRQSLWERSTRFDAIRGKIIAACALVSLGWLIQSLAAEASAAGEDGGEDIQLELSPRICTLAINDKQCEINVRASWRAPRTESLCLIIVDRPEVKRCWENYSEGTYSIELTFAENLVFQLKDLELQHVLASDVLRVIREAIRYRHKRRQPWNIFD
jgi:Protein of unknown function (DUF3019)